MLSLNADQKIHLLETMVASREGDRREGILYRQGKGWFQIASVGHEALGALGMLLRADDYLFPHYRDRALVMTKGMTSRDCARGFMGKVTSSSGGRQLPGHFSSKEHRIWSMPSPTGSNLLPACGVAWGMQLDGADTLVMGSVGDAGMRQGEFYEAYCFAVQLNLPVIFVVEDNHYGISTSTLNMNPMRLDILDSRRIVKVDGRDVDALFSAGSEAVARARAGKGPAILWCELDRLCSHSSSDDQRQYVSEEDLGLMEERDPIRRLETQLLTSNVLKAAEWEERKQAIVREINSVYEEVAQEDDPNKNDIFSHIKAFVEDVKEPVLDGGKEFRIVDALNSTFRRALEHDRRVIFFGEDVADPMGGVFKLTKGLSPDYPDRVFNSPLAEATIVGIACGLASYGMRPVFELQFIDFVGPAWNQIVTNLSTLRWRTNGEWSCPVVLYAPYGAYLPGGGPWHSQSNESSFAHLPGIRTVVPSTPEDAAGLMMTAMKSEDPTIFLIPKHLLRARLGAPEKIRPIAFGSGRQVREGWDITVVAWGNTVEQVMLALEGQEERLSADVIDLRSIMPWDRDLVKASVLRTGRLMVVQEDNRSSSVGQMIIQELLEDKEVFESLKQPPRLLSRADVHVGFHPNYEWGVLPLAEQIRTVLMTVLQETITLDSNTEPSASDSLEKDTDLMTATQSVDAENKNPSDSQVPLSVPSVGEGLEEARILKLFKKVGEAVKKDEPLYQLETDKAVVDVESPSDGVVLQWLAAEDSIIEVGARIGILSTHGASVPLVRTETPRVEASPVEKEPALVYEERALSPSQQILAGRLARAAQVAVPATLFHAISWENLLQVREGLKSHEDAKTFTSFSLAAWCVVRALKKHPTFRSCLPKSSVLRVYKNVHLGVAVSLGEDLTTAVVENADTLGYGRFARRMKLQVERARKGQDQAGLQTSVILTSLTTMNIRDAIPVIVPPAMATLALSSPYDELYLDHGQVKSRTMLNISMTIDHRVVNGAGAAAFLNEVKNQMETIRLKELEIPVAQSRT
ncbi:MAG: thiamine pyrophosphate-dependent enzyme [Candidatus Methylacidiphilales bacterium]